MRFPIPNWINELEKKFKPYLVDGGASLSINAPDEAKKAYSEFREWFDKQFELL